jgi:hypothetical protein
LAVGLDTTATGSVLIFSLMFFPKLPLGMVTDSENKNEDKKI